MLESYFATCPDETKEILAGELKDLGAEEISLGYRVVSFKATEEVFYRLHLELSTASNLFKKLRECSAKTDKMLFSQARRIAWDKIFSSHQSYRVDGVAGDRGEEAMSSNEMSKQVRHAIENEFQRKGLRIPKVELKTPQLIFMVFIYKGRATISVQTSGKALHKRGYRLSGGHPAPLKETFAASLLRLIGYDGSEVLLDPMCGSGTIPIEAAFRSLGKGCNIHRKKGQFGLEHLASFNKDLWRKIQDDVRSNRKERVPQDIYASDIDQDYIAAAKENALRARVEKEIDFSQNSFFDLEKPCDTGIIICNLPYGERIESNEENLEIFYKKIGDHLKKEFSGWKAYLLVSEDSPWKHIGLKPKRKTPLLNGSIKTKLLYYELYAGSKKISKNSEIN